jgi:uncharacterized membrane protein YphA (DoxX/SURF4 family)
MSRLWNGAEAVAQASPRTRGRTIAYWAVTSLLVAAIATSGIGQLMQYGGNIELVTTLGYPLYVLTILGVWKLLGAAALVAPGLPRLKEWAHAALNMASWALRPKSRSLSTRSSAFPRVSSTK